MSNILTINGNWLTVNGNILTDGGSTPPGPTPPGPTPTGDYDYKIQMKVVASINLYVNTICMDRSQEGTGNCYSDAACTNELYNLEAWDTFTPDTELTDYVMEYDETIAQFCNIFTVYIKNVVIDTYNMGTIIQGSSTNYGFYKIEVYDKYDNQIAMYQNSEDYPLHWVEYNYFN